MMPSHLIGETAGVCTSILWTFGSILFTQAGRRIGALSVNAFRIIFGIVLLGATHLFVFGTIIPQANPSQFFYMGLSGVVGLTIGDYAYFGALVLIGPRRGVLLMSLAPIFSAISAYLVMGEILGLWAIIGIATTLSGVGLVILEREGNSGEVPLSKRQKTIGILLGLGGSLGQGIGLVISKYGMIAAADNPIAPLNPLSATLIRMVVAAIFIWIFVLTAGKWSNVLDSLKDKKGITRTFGGAVTGPFLGVWLSMVAVTYTKAGVAATLISLMPVMIIPVVWILFKQKTSWRGILGAGIAVIGVAILFST
jgi:drug/metabolite transporter (DMT)-like permease